MADKTEHRFVFLDGLRGLAALCVGIFHATLLFKFEYLPRHAVLAVDFFFCLSGFVIAFAYDDRLKAGMSFGRFMKARVIRLYPMIFVTVLFGGALLMGQHDSAGPSIIQSLLLTLASLFLVPLGLWFGMQAYPLNDPLWSLFFEMIANAGYGMVAKRLPQWMAWAALVACAVLLVRAVRSDAARGIAEIGFANYKLFCFGFIRVAFPFLAGVLLYRAGVRKQIPPAMGGIFVVAALLLMLLNSVPILNPVPYDLVCALLVIPALVFLGARVKVAGHISTLCTWGGAISYPFYLIHGPMMSLVNSTLTRTHVIGPGVSAALALLAAGVASYVVLKIYDIPVRAWLSRRQRQSRSQASTGRLSSSQSTL